VSGHLLVLGGHWHVCLRCPRGPPLALGSETANGICKSLSVAGFGVVRDGAAKRGARLTPTAHRAPCSTRRVPFPSRMPCAAGACPSWWAPPLRYPKITLGSCLAHPTIHRSTAIAKCSGVWIVSATSHAAAPRFGAGGGLPTRCAGSRLGVVATAPGPHHRQRACQQSAWWFEDCPHFMNIAARTPSRTAGPSPSPASRKGTGVVCMRAQRPHVLWPKELLIGARRCAPLPDKSPKRRSPGGQRQKPWRSRGPARPKRLC
jgi:hypothetical protein